MERSGGPAGCAALRHLWADRGAEGPYHSPGGGIVSVVVTRDGGRVSPVLPDENTGFGWLLHHQGQSVHYATTHGGYAIVTLPELDDRDGAILDKRAAWLLEREGPAVGDFVDFPGEVRRISHVWDFGGGDPVTVQTSTLGGISSGRYYLGDGYLSFSGGLRPAIAADLLTDADKLRAGSVWFFHHGYAAAHNGVDTAASFRVWSCAEVAP